jgi:hypothetical protein
VAGTPGTATEAERGVGWGVGRLVPQGIGKRHSQNFEVDVQLEPFEVLVRVPPRTGVGPAILAVSAGSDHLSLDAKIAVTPRLAF